MNFHLHFSKKYDFLTPNDLQRFLQITTLKKFKRGEKLIDVGDESKKTFMVLKGLIRGYITNYQGKEITTFLFREYHALAAYEPLILGEPSRQVFECLEATEVLELDYEELDKLAKSNPRIKQAVDAIIMEHLSVALRRNESFILKSPEQRYLAFLENHGDMLQRVSQKHIASYLGITAVSFSRLKKRIYEQQNKS
ncbi:MAG: Crp/Fnr family transcriptional regulator [Bacteroidota bacterium]